jgi:AraC-like DNA-binding protein
MEKNTHQHMHREIMMVLEGSHFYGVRGKLFEATPGTLFLLDRNEPHDRSYSPYQKDCRNLWLFLLDPRRAAANEVVVEKGKLRIRQRYRVLDGSLAEELAELWDLCREGHSNSFHFAKLRAFTSCLIFKILSAPEDVPVSSQESFKKSIVPQIMSHIETHLGEDLSLRTLAQMAGYDPFYFHRLFQRHTGQTLRMYINERRMMRAKELLMQGKQVQSVAEDLGFATVAYFSRFFSKKMGFAPSFWQEKRFRDSSQKSKLKSR